MAKNEPCQHASPRFSRARRLMVERQLVRRGIADPRVMAAMGEVPREAFLDDASRENAYRDAPLPIGCGQTISQPYIVAFMVEAARVVPGDRVLEVGTGSGYAAAVLAGIAGEVHGIEWHEPLARAASRRLQRLGYRNVIVTSGDGSIGKPEAAPFDVIIVSAGAPRVPEKLKGQLAIAGRLIVPVGSERGLQHLLRIVRTDEARFHEEQLAGVMFVPLVGEDGWRA